MDKPARLESRCGDNFLRQCSTSRRHNKEDVNESIFSGTLAHVPAGSCAEAKFAVDNAVRQSVIAIHPAKAGAPVRISLDQR